MSQVHGSHFDHFTVSDIINLLAVQNVNIDRFWVRNFVMRHKEQLCSQKARVLEEDRDDVSPDEVRSYFDTGLVNSQQSHRHLCGTWMRQESGVRKGFTQPKVIAATNMKPGSVTAPEEQNDAQSTLLTAISASGDLTCPLFISKLKTFETALLAVQKRDESHACAIRPAPRTFII
jgi:hypothetical protein